MPLRSGPVLPPGHAKGQHWLDYRRCIAVQIQCLVYAGDDLSVQLCCDGRSRIKRRIEHPQHLARCDAGVGTRFAPYLPKRSLKGRAGRRADDSGLPVVVKADCGVQRASIAAGGIVNAGRPVFCRVTAPCPKLEIIFQWPRSEIGIEIAVTRPLPALCRQIDLDVG